MPSWGGGYNRWPVKRLRGIPNHETYRAKLREKWHRKHFQVEFV